MKILPTGNNKKIPTPPELEEIREEYVQERSKAIKVR